MSFNGEQLERSLLTGQWREQAGDPSQNVIARLGKQVVDGEFKAFLRSPLARELLTLRSDALDDLSSPIKSWFDFSVPSAGGDYERELVHLLAAVACLHAFLQANWTGPDLDVDPLSVLDLPQQQQQQRQSSITTTTIAETLQQKAVAELACAGEPAYHLAGAAFLFRLALVLLDGLDYDCHGHDCHDVHVHVRSVAWWRMRAWKVHEQLLGEPVPVPIPRNADADAAALADAYADEPDLVGRLWLERGLLEHHQANERAALECFVRAARATGLQYELTGALGRRTKFQQTDLTQLVLLAESRARDADGREGSADELAKKLPETLALNDDTLLEQTEFTSSNPAAPGSHLGHLDPSDQPALHPLDQCILLSLCLNVRNTSPAHGLTTEQMTPYVARVISHPENWSVHTMALLLRSRLEAHRTRTVERSTLQLQALVDQMPTADSALAERLRLLHALPLPSKWELERELALRFLSLGVVKSALAIFERLEMWEEAVRCWQAIEQRDRALALVRDLLEGRRAEAEAVLARGKASASSGSTRRAALDAAREARLWCLLGELEPEQARERFERAWAVSGQTSGRAMRSLGGYFFAREEYAEAARCLRRAVAINPLFSRSWFILGCACVRVEDWEGAREAFARCVTIDDEDAESWNNLASVYLRMDTVPGKTVSQKEVRHDEQQPSLQADQAAAIPFENKMLAFRALKQGLRFHYENWRMWMNYTVVAMDVGEFAEACRALGRVVEERAAKVGPESVDEDVLDRLVDAATRELPDGSDGGAHNPNETNESHGLLRRVEDLFVRIILPRVSSPRIFRARARLLAAQGKLPGALEAHLEGYRAGIAGQMEAGETDLERWRQGVREVEDIYDLLVNYGPKVEGSRWKLQARSIVRTFMGRSRDFEDEPEWSRLLELLNDLKQGEGR
ncbi:TPR-like protein [Lactifluus subvellereus]|nr:TPR-like protein [Lactifluus subvellereus]